MFKHKKIKTLEHLLISCKPLSFTDEDIPFSSEIISPGVHFDAASVASHVDLWKLFMHEFRNLCEVKRDIFREYAIASVATGGILFGSQLAFDLEMPHIYVRKKSKGHAKNRVIEGDLDVIAGRKIIFVEDVVTSARSVILAAEHLRSEGFQVDIVLAAFTHKFPKTKENLRKAKLKLRTVTDLTKCLPVAENLGVITKGQKVKIKEWQKSSGEKL